MSRMMLALRVRFASDKRKASILLGLFGMLAFLTVKQLGIGSPSSADASAGAGGSDDPFSSLVSTASMDDLGFKGPIIRVPRPEAVTRDLFRPNPSVFPSPTPVETTPAEAAKSRARIAEVPPTAPPDNEPTPRQLVVQQADGLRLKSVMMGHQPIAIVRVSTDAGSETEMLGPGDTILGFSVVEITSSRVTLEMQGIRVNLDR